MATPETPERTQLQALLTKAQDGDKAALQQIKENYPDVPAAFEVNMAQQAQEAIIAVLAGKDLLLAEGVRHNVAVRRKQISGENPTPLESLLVGRILTCWLHLHYYEALYAQNLKNGGMSIDQSLSQQRRIDGAHRRYLSAIRTLAQVRRLQIPAVQVNIAARGGQQVNVAAAAAGTDHAHER